MHSFQSEDCLNRLRTLYAQLRDALHAHVSHTAIESLSQLDRHEGGDAIYALDSHGEEILLPFCEDWGRETPFLLVCEGLPEGRQFFGCNDLASAQFIAICDPIDGTRPLMYDKRSAFFLFGIAPNKGEATNLSDIEVALQGELPTSRAGWADCLWAAKGGGAYGEAYNLYTRQTRSIRVTPSGATSIEGGYAMLSKFFVGSKGFLAQLEEQLVAEILGPPTLGTPQTFDDQYISNGGQLYEIMTGRDRFNGDLRPFAHQKLFGDDSSRLCSHPYDLCTELIAREAGAIVTDGYGNRLTAPLDVESPVSWLAYANEDIRRQVEPVLMRLLEEAGF